MGVDVCGGMIVGESGAKLVNPDSYDLDQLSLYYDAPEEDRYYGFNVDDVIVSDMEGWLADVRALAKEFEELTGVPARLIGAQDIT